MEPKPIRPSRGSGEAVCGRPSFLAVVVSEAAAFWSLLCAEVALLWQQPHRWSWWRTDQPKESSLQQQTGRC